LLETTAHPASREQLLVPADVKTGQQVSQNLLTHADIQLLLK
jgi:hypothetical protein